MTSSMIGNDERREVPMLELLAVFVVIARLSVCASFFRKRTQEPSLKSKMPFSGGVAHAKSG